jgi:hypothetical protein
MQNDKKTERREFCKVFVLQTAVSYNYSSSELGQACAVSTLSLLSEATS